MRVCYVDEAGCLGMLPSATSPIQPVFVIAGVSLPRDRLNDITHEFLGVNKRFFPGLSPGSYLDTVLSEVKGADLRRSVAEAAATSEDKPWASSTRYSGC